MVERKQRVPFRDFSTLSEEDRKLGEANSRDGKPINIFRVLMNNPKLARKWGTFGAYILGGSTLPEREREIAILRIGWLNQSPYEFEQHVIIGKRSGLTDAEIEMIKKGPSAGWSAKDKAIVQAADDLFENSIISDSTWAALSSTWSLEQTMDFVFTIGQYNLVSWALNSFGVPLDEYLPGAKKA